MKKIYLVVDLKDGCEPRLEDLKDILVDILRMEEIDGVSLKSGDEYALRKKIPLYTPEAFIGKTKEDGNERR